MSASSTAMRLIQRRVFGAAVPVRRERPAVTLWQVQDAADANYRRCLELLDECDTPADRVRVIAEIRQHLTFAAQVLQSARDGHDAEAFMDAVMTALDECDPVTRNSIMMRLSEARDERRRSLPLVTQEAVS